MRRWTRVFGRYDWALLLSVFSLSAIGLLAIFGIGISGGAHDLFQFNKQLLAVALGLAFALSIAFVDYRQLRTLALPIYGLGAAALALALFFGTTNRNGGKWFVLGSLSFQPVEFAKITLVIFLAAYVARHAHKRLTWTALVGTIAILGIYAGLTLAQPDFGSAMVLVAVWGAIVLFCGLPRHAWWIFLVAIAVIGTFLWTVGLKPYQKDRITSFFDPARDPRGASYNVAQARIAIGSGQIFGKGIGEGSQARLRFLPEASTDFMFAVLGEELGFVGLSVVLALFGFLLTRLVRIAMRAEDAFASICLIGFAAIIAFHLFVNAGMNLGIMPVTGIPLPFASAAASSLVMMFVSVGIAEAIAVQSHGQFT